MSSILVRISICVSSPVFSLLNLSVSQQFLLSSYFVFISFFFLFEVKMYIVDLKSFLFFSVNIQCNSIQFPSQNYFSCIPFILIYCTFIFILFNVFLKISFKSSSLIHGLFRNMLFNFLLSVTKVWFHSSLGSVG